MTTADRPITLITGTPGGGKTALAVQIMQHALKEGRPIFVMGIPELKLPHSPTPPINEWTARKPDPDNPELSLPFFTFPERSLIVLDEAQRVYRLRSASSNVPDHVAAFETVRHTGVTFLLITQHPNFIDTHIRRLIGRHIHLRDVGVLGRWKYEWPEACDPDTYHSAPSKVRYKLPKEVFDLYQSSSLHIKRSNSIPPALLVFMILMLLLPLGGYQIYRSISEKTSSPDQGVMQPVQSNHTKPSIVPTDRTLETLVIEQQPRISGRPETAPAYDHLRVVKVMPLVAGCFQTANQCRCYTQQGTDAYLNHAECRNWITARPFNPYYEEAQQEGNESGEAASVPPLQATEKPPQKAATFPM